MKIKNCLNYSAKFGITFILAALILLPACSGISSRTSYVDPDVEDGIGGTGIESQDIRSVTQQMCRSILNSAAIQKCKTKPRIEIVSMKNTSRFRINTGIFTLKIRNNLICYGGSEMTFLATKSDRRHVERIRNEKREGITDSKKQTIMKGADYILSGDVTSLSKANNKYRSDYVVLSFELIDAETREVVWADTFEMKKQGILGVIYR